MANNRHSTTVEVNADTAQAEAGLQRLSNLLDQLHQKAGSLAIGGGGGGGGGAGGGGGPSGTNLPSAPPSGGGGGAPPPPPPTAGREALQFMARGMPGGGMLAGGGAIASQAVDTFTRAQSLRRGGTFTGYKEAELAETSLNMQLGGAAVGMAAGAAWGSAAGPAGTLVGGAIGLGAGYLAGKINEAEFASKKPGIDMLLGAGGANAQRAGSMGRLRSSMGGDPTSGMFDTWSGGRHMGGPGGMFARGRMANGRYKGIFESVGQMYGATEEQAMGNIQGLQAGSRMGLHGSTGNNTGYSHSLEGTGRNVGGFYGPKGESTFEFATRMQAGAGIDPSSLGALAGAASEYGGGMGLKGMESAVGTFQNMGMSSSGVNQMLQQIASSTAQLAQKGVAVDTRDMMKMMRQMGSQFMDDAGKADRWSPGLAAKATGITQGFGSGPMQQLTSPFKQIADWQALSSASDAAGPNAGLADIMGSLQGLQGTPTKMRKALAGRMDKDSFAMAYGNQGLNIEAGRDLHGLDPNVDPGLAKAKTRAISDEEKQFAQGRGSIVDKLSEISTAVMNMDKLAQSILKGKIKLGVSGGNDVFENYGVGGGVGAPNSAVKTWGGNKQGL